MSVTLPHFVSCVTALSGDDSTDSVVLAAPGDVVILPCYNVGNVTPTVTTWMKNGREIISGSSTTSAGSPTSSGEHLTVQQDGSLNIRAVLSGDEGTYLCASTLPGNYTFHARVLLQVASKSVSHSSVWLALLEL